MKVSLPHIHFRLQSPLIVGLTIASDLLRSAGNIHAFQFLYYFLPVWGQYGPNATKWLLASEVNPSERRALGHGLSAATGKVMSLAKYCPTCGEQIAIIWSKCTHS